MKKLGRAILFLIVIFLVVALVVIYYLQLKNTSSANKTKVQTSDNVLSQITASQTPTFKKASIAGVVTSGSQIAEGFVEIGGIKYTLQDGKFTIKSLNSGIYPVLYTDENGNKLGLNPPSMQIFPGENSSFEFSVTP